MVYVLESVTVVCFLYTSPPITTAIHGLLTIIIGVLIFFVMNWAGTKMLSHELKNKSEQLILHSNHEQNPTPNIQ